MTWLHDIGGKFSASWHLAAISLRRLAWSRQTVISILLLSLAAVAVFAWSHRRDRTPADFIEDILVTVYMSFLLPMFCLSFASAGVSTDREEQTLVYLLTTPLPRPWILLAKLIAALVMSLAWTIGSLAVLCYLAGKPGVAAFSAVWPAIFAATLAYVALFQLFSVVFRRATIVSLGYALFLETLVGNMPGIVKRLTISFYARCLFFEAAADLGIGPTGPFNPLLFQPLPAATAQLVIYTGSGALLLAGLVIFTTREY
jgi:ABC-type transport system involved in multi-copper enzyme maturation permease subunit